MDDNGIPTREDTKIGQNGEHLNNDYYDKAAKHWEQIDPTIDGMLGKTQY